MFNSNSWLMHKNKNGYKLQNIPDISLYNTTPPFFGNLVDLRCHGAWNPVPGSRRAKSRPKKIHRNVQTNLIALLDQHELIAGQPTSTSVLFVLSSHV